MDEKNKYHDHRQLNELSLEIYNDRVFARNYADKIEYNAHNALYERPATLSLLSEVKDKSVLDAGCGPGTYTDWLLERGASVTAIDYSDEMIALVKDRVGDKARVIKANMNERLEFLEDEEFDMVLSSMALHYLRDWRHIFNEFNRVLKTKGEIVFSIHHPFMEFQLHPEGNYFETELIEDEWPSFNITMKYYRRPLSHVFEILEETDFLFAEILEPRPLPECKNLYPDSFESLDKNPWFICFKAVKRK